MSDKHHGTGLIEFMKFPNYYKYCNWIRCMTMKTITNKETATKNLIVINI